MLSDKLVLIVEDDPFIAMGLALAVEDLSGLVSGPVDSVEEAFGLLGKFPVNAAILDSELSDRDVTPVALQLIESNVPFVLHTGTGIPGELAKVHPSLPVLLKPMRPAEVVAALIVEIKFPYQQR